MKRVKKVEPWPDVLTDEQIDAVTVEELRAAYRELASYQKTIRLKIKDASIPKVNKLRAAGKAVGEPPYGFRTNLRTGKLREKADEQKVIAFVKALHAQELKPYSIAKQLNEDPRFAPREGSRFHPTQIRRILEAEELRERIAATDPGSKESKR